MYKRSKPSRPAPPSILSRTAQSSGMPIIIGFFYPYRRFFHLYIRSLLTPVRTSECRCRRENWPCALSLQHSFTP